MSYADRNEAYANDVEYAKLLQLQTRVEDVATDWINRATALHGVTTDSADKTELVALRDAFAVSLTAILAG